MFMTKLIVFSKDRPCQLQALLDSVELHTKGFFNKITVVYKSTNDEFKNGYELLKKRRPYVDFLQETNFKKNIIDSFELDYTCFAADDDIIYRDFNRGLFNFFGDDTSCVSLRLGLNINYCYSNNKPNTLKEYQDFGEFIKWDWTKEELDFAYPLSVVSHIFQTKEIKEWSEKIGDFENPNVYEGKLQILLKEVKPYMVAYKESKIFGVPANRVNVSAANRNGLEFSYSTNELNDLYLNGQVIDITKIPTINAAQQEIQYVFKYL